jgi:FtsZ-interacting cell division protein ZipA
MDATTLRWTLALIGVLVIGGVYGYSLWQERRRRSTTHDLSREELEAGFIGDEALREELAALGNPVEDGRDLDVKDIRIHPGEDVQQEPPMEALAAAKPDAGQEADAVPRFGEHCIVHVLKQREDRPLSGDAILLACERSGLELDAESFFQPRDSAGKPPFRCANLSRSGRFTSIQEAAFKTRGLLCWFDPDQQAEPLRSYERMLKGIDELVRELDLKVYNQDLELLTLQHVTDIRHRLQRPPEPPEND